MISKHVKLNALDVQELAKDPKLQVDLIFEALNGKHSHSDLAYLVCLLCRELSNSMDQNEHLRTAANFVEALRAPEPIDNVKIGGTD